MKPIPALQRIRVPAFLMADYLFRRPEDMPARLYLLLHGFGQTAWSLWKRLEPALPAAAAVLSPNAPFPMPRRVPASGGRKGPESSDEGEWVVGFSWYFYNPDTDEYFIDMEIGVHFLQELVRKLGLESVPMTVIGFSQGGYLAPFLAQALSNVDHVVGIGCQFLVEELSLPVRFRLDAIHGERDERVSPELAKAYHKRLVEAGTRGEFVLVPEAGHGVNASVLNELWRLLGWS